MPESGTRRRCGTPSGSAVTLVEFAGANTTRSRVALRGVQDVFEVALFGLRRHPRRGAGAHGFDENDRGLGHLGEAERFRHQCEATAGGPGHGLHAGVGCTERQRSGRDLVFDRSEMPPNSTRCCDTIVERVVRRRHGCSPR